MLSLKNTKKNVVGIITVVAILAGMMPTLVMAAPVVATATTGMPVVGELETKITGTAYSEPPQAIFEKGIAYSLTASVLNPVLVSANVGTVCNFEVKLQGLAPGTKYYAKAYIKYVDESNTPQIKFATNEVTFTTLVPAAVNVSVSNPQITYDSASKVYAASSFNAQNLAVKRVGFVYSNYLATPDVINGAQRVETNWTSGSQSTYQLQLTNMTGNVTYNVRAFIEYVNTSGAMVIAYSPGGTQFTQNNYMQNKPVVTTESAEFADLKITAKGTVASNSGDAVTEVGFVYSTSNTTPTIDNSTKAIASEVKNNTFSTSWPIDSTNTVYYVRAYAKNSNGYNYGYAITVNIGNAKPIVYTKEVKNVTLNSADVLIDVLRTGNSPIIERGVVYSSTSDKPTLYNSNTQYRAASGTLGEANIILSGLMPNTKYYVRAYARNSDGASYGQILDFFTFNNESIKTLDPTNIKETSAQAKGSIKDIDQSKIKEKGFVYSPTQATPTIEDSRVTTSSNVLGEFLMDLTGLTKTTKYYIRTYIKTDSGYVYGNVVNFTTTGELVNISIDYLDGTATVGSQIMNSNTGMVLTGKDLVLPKGYRLYDPAWSHTVTGANRINVPVVRNTAGELPFMDGVGNYMFAPDKPAKRAEIAQILYNLSKNKTYTPSKTYTDVPSNYYAKEAIDFVSSKSLMQGYPDGSFKPEDPIKRSEICVVLTLFYNLSGQATSNFIDVPSTYWSYKYISLAYSNGMIYGYPNGTFRPENNITRAEVATLFCSSENRSIVPLGTQDFVDVSKDYWAYKYIMNVSVPKP